MAELPPPPSPDASGGAGDKIEPVVETGVDELLKLLKSHEKLPITEAARLLSLPQDVVQSWIDFLVEEKILGVEYKFTVPYVFLNAPHREQASGSQLSSSIASQTLPSEQSASPLPLSSKTLADFRDEFNKRAESTLPQGKGRLLTVNLWTQHLRSELERKRSVFFAEAAKRNLADPEKLWAVYTQKVMET